MVQKYTKKDVLFQQAVEKDIEEAIFVHDEEQKEEEEKERWSAKSENELVEEFSRLLRVSEGTMKRAFASVSVRAAVLSRTRGW